MSMTCVGDTDVGDESLCQCYYDEHYEYYEYSIYHQKRALYDSCTKSLLFTVSYVTFFIYNNKTYVVQCAT